MPYTAKQCRYFGANPEDAPSDWKEKCKGVTMNDSVIIIDSKLEICDQSFKRTPQGYLQVDAIIARSGEQQYHAIELGLPHTGTVILDRPAEEVTDPIAISSFMNMPVTDDHPPGHMVDASNFTKYAKGMVIDVEPTESKNLKATLLVSDGALIKKIENGKRELSAGYAAEVEFNDSMTRGVQRKIRGNHVALVDKARCGKECRIFDSAHDGGKSNMPEENTTMAKLTINGVEYEFNDSVAPVIQTVLKDAEKATEKAEKLQAKLDATEEKVTELEGKVISDEDFASMIEDAANARVKVLLDSARWLKDYDPTGKSISDIKRDAIKAHSPEVEISDATDTYVDARFDIMLEDAKKEKGNSTINDALRKKDGSEGDDMVAEARKRKMARFQKKEG